MRAWQRAMPTRVVHSWNVRPATWRARAAVGVMLALAGGVALADLSFYQDLPQSRMTADDNALANATLARALDEGQEGQTYTWQNAATGASGSVRLRSPPFVRDGMTCRRAVIAAAAKGLANESTWMLCRTGDGWKIAGE
jgi:surface antigen